MKMRLFALILAFLSPQVFAADQGAAKLDNLKDSAAPVKKDFAVGKKDLMDALEFRKKMEAKVYLSRKKILDEAMECVKKAKDPESIWKCDAKERKSAFESVQETQKLLVEFGKKMKKARSSLGMPEPMSPQDAAAMQAMNASAKANAVKEMAK